MRKGQIFLDDPSYGLPNFVEIRRDDEHLNVCNFHGNSRPGDKLDTQAREKQSAGTIREFALSNIPVVIGGDFNLLPQTRSILTCEDNGYKNLISDDKIIPTRDELSWSYHSDHLPLILETE